MSDLSMWCLVLSIALSLAFINLRVGRIAAALEAQSARKE